MPEILRNILGTASGFLTRALVSAFPILNILFIVTAAGFGTLLHRMLSRRYRDVATLCIGGILVLTGISQLWDNFFVLADGQLETTGTVLVLVALPLGYLFGEAIMLDKVLGMLGKRLHKLVLNDDPVTEGEGKDAGTKKKKSSKGSLPTVSMDLLTRETETYSPNGFVIATLVCAFGSPAIRCAVESRLENVAAPLLYKILLDVVIILLVTSIYGSSAVFSALPVLITEGVLVLVARVWGHLLTPTLVRQMCLVGAAIITAVGFNLSLGKKFKAGNLIPAVLIPPLFGLAMMLIEKATEGK